MTTDTFTVDLMAAAAPMRAGDKATSRARFQVLWDRIAGDLVYEFVLAHQMADAQDDPNAELFWDLRALDAAQRSNDADVDRHYPGATLASFWPSLHINLAEDYFKLGDLEQSRAHLTLARQTVPHLPDDAYGQLIRRGIERLAKKLETPPVFEGLHIDSTYHAALFGLMVVGGVGSFLWIAVLEYRRRTSERPAEDMDAYERQRQLSGLALMVGVVLAALVIWVLSLLW